jgi:hypothetical protein
VRLTALIGNPQGLNPVRVVWRTCIPELREAVSPCLDEKYLRDPEGLEKHPDVIVLGEGERIEVTIPTLVGPLLQSLIDRARSKPEYACSPYVSLPVLITVSGGDQVQRAFKRVRLAPYRALDKVYPPSKYVRNLNPVIQGLRRNPTHRSECYGGDRMSQFCQSDADCAGAVCSHGLCASPIPHEEQIICSHMGDGSSQIFNECNADGTTRRYYEAMRYQWYATGGSLRQAEDSSDAPSGRRVRFVPPDGPYTLWLIVRDGRGGEHWMRRDVP